MGLVLVLSAHGEEVNIEDHAAGVTRSHRNSQRNVSIICTLCEGVNSIDGNDRHRHDNLIGKELWFSHSQGQRLALKQQFLPQGCTACCEQTGGSFAVISCTSWSIFI